MRIFVCCPSCSKKGYIEVHDDTFKDINRGIIAVNVAENSLCQHSFIAYVDKNFSVRDYFIADFRVELPNIVLLKEIEEKISKKDTIDVFLIRINLHAIQITYILKSIFHKKRVAIILDDLRYGSKLNSEIINFFKYIAKDSFNADISMISKEMYQKNRNKYKEFMVFEGNKIYRDVNNILNLKELKVESQIVQKFMSESNLLASLIILKNEIRKVFNLSKSIAEFVNNYKEKQKLNSKIITDYLSNVYKILLSRTHLDFSIEIVKNYFEAEIPEFERISDFLGFLK